MFQARDISFILLDVWLLRVWPRGKKSCTYILRQKDICFTLIYGPFAKINSIFAAGGWVEDSVLLEPHSMNLKQDISSDCLKMFFSIWFHMEKSMRNVQG